MSQPASDDEIDDHGNIRISSANRSNHSSPRSIVSLNLADYHDAVLENIGGISDGNIVPRNKQRADSSPVYDNNTIYNNQKTTNNNHSSHHSNHSSILASPKNSSSGYKKSNSSGSLANRDHATLAHRESHSSHSLERDGYNATPATIHNISGLTHYSNTGYNDFQNKFEQKHQKYRKTSLKNRTSSITSQPVCPIELQKTLDPQIQEELENLNFCSNQINQIENELECARSEHRAVLQSISTTLLSKTRELNLKRSDCVKKARPFYIAKYKAKLAQKMAEEATIKYQRAVQHHEDAKEMVCIAEMNMKMAPTDPAWHQMLNVATNRVNEAEIERTHIETTVKNSTKSAFETQTFMAKLNKEHKQSIKDAREYFDLKNRLSENLDGRQEIVEKKQEELDAAKVEYKQALKRLENISERIHFAREQASVAKKRHLSRQKNSSLNSSSYKRKCSDASAISSHDDNCNSNSISTDDKPRVSTTSSGGIHILQNNNNSNSNSNRPTLHLDLQSHQLSNNSQENNFIIDPSQLEESQSVLEIALAKHRQRFGENQMVLSPTKNYIPEFYSEAHMNNDIHSDLKRRDSLENLDQATDSNLTSRQGSSEINISSGAASEKVDFSKNLNKLNQQMNHLNLGSTSTGISRTSGISSDMENYLMKERILDDNIKNIDNEKKVGTFQGHRSALSSGYGGSFKSNHNAADDLESSPNGNLTRKGHHRNSSTGNKMGGWLSLNVKDLGK